MLTLLEFDKFAQPCVFDVSLMQVCLAFRDKTLTLALEIFDNLCEGLFEVLDFALQVFRLFCVAETVLRILKHLLLIELEITAEFFCLLLELCLYSLQLRRFLHVKFEIFSKAAVLLEDAFCRHVEAVDDFFVGVAFDFHELRMCFFLQACFFLYELALDPCHCLLVRRLRVIELLVHALELSLENLLAIFKRFERKELFAQLALLTLASLLFVLILGLHLRNGPVARLVGVAHRSLGICLCRCRFLGVYSQLCL
mmetsp:Transcript_60539/g.98092  ORF Transcript_60539/g.98092 Transcript_60539/m.98092 type:complete len:255 (+) Transcript_60539:172-936(+)